MCQFMSINIYRQVVLIVKMISMAMNYNKLWKLLIDKSLSMKDLREMAGLSTNAIAKMGKGGDVSTEVLRKICMALDCGIEDIVEIIPDKNDNCVVKN